ncbi:MAG: hypothetical protein FJ312_02215 [SAR202 cluster bacterium]|nr:hypothetical protein [SAR202 cluster bacterium]
MHLVVQSAASPAYACREGCVIDQATIERALILTAIGAGTALAVLIFLTIFVQASGLLINLPHAWSARRRAGRVPVAEAETREQAERALAAVVAVGALLAEPRRASRSGVQAGNAPP